MDMFHCIGIAKFICSYQGRLQPVGFDTRCRQKDEVWSHFPAFPLSISTIQLFLFSLCDVVGSQ